MPGNGREVREPALFLDREFELHAAYINQIAIGKALGSSDGGAIYSGHAIAAAQIISIVAAIDLRGHFGFEPATEPNGGHFGAANDGEFTGQRVFPLFDWPADANQCSHADTRRGDLRAF